MVNGLRKKLKDSFEGFNNLRQQISSEYREIVQRRYFTVTIKNPDDKTVDLLISTGHLLFRHFSNFLLRFLGDFIGNFQRDLCVLFGLDFCCFFFGFLLVLKETFIGGVVDAGDQVMGFTVAEVPLQI